MKPIQIILSLIVFIGFNCTNHKYSEIEKDKIIQGILVQRLTSNSVSGTPSCSSTSPTFASLANAGVSSKCGSCHSGGNQTAGLDMSSYTSVSAKLKVNNPEGSTLYAKINGGSMTSYSDATINTTVYCWIKAGAPQ